MSPWVQCECVVRVCRDAYLVGPVDRRVRRTALMTMPFGYVGIENVFFRFTATRACPCSAWFVVHRRRGHSVWAVTFLFILSPRTRVHARHLPPRPFPAEGGKDSSQPDDRTWFWICVCYRSFHRPSCPRLLCLARGWDESDFASCVTFVPCTSLSRDWCVAVLKSKTHSVPTYVGVRITAGWRGAELVSGLRVVQGLCKPNLT
jgi:hypothetical protein